MVWLPRAMQRKNGTIWPLGRLPRAVAVQTAILFYALPKATKACKTRLRGINFTRVNSLAIENPKKLHNSKKKYRKTFVANTERGRGQGCQTTQNYRLDLGSWKIEVHSANRERWASFWPMPTDWTVPKVRPRPWRWMNWWEGKGKKSTISQINAKRIKNKIK